MAASCSESPAESPASPRLAAATAPSRIYNNPLSSPNATPPRTSSTGLQNMTQGMASQSQSQGNSQSQGQGQGNSHSHSFVLPTPLPSVLGPVSEADWLSPKKQTTNWHLPIFSPAMAIMQHQHQQNQHQNGEPPNVDRYAYADLNFPPKQTWTPEKEMVIRAPYDYTISHPGKDFRAMLIAAFDAWLQTPPASLQIITKVIAMLHETSLLIDDVQDSSELRRGFPVAHHIFGVAQTINTANYMCFVALQELQRLNNPEAITIFADELTNLHRGHGMDLFWRDTLTCPTEEEYLEMVGNKTGGLFRLGIKLMRAESTSNMDCVPLVNLIGLIYQIRDDYMNLSSSDYTTNKGLCEDLTEGKFSFPIIHSIRADPANLQLINILKQKTTDVQVKRYAASYMESTGTFTYTRAVVTTLIDRARRMALELDAGQNRVGGIMKILDKMMVE